MPIREIISRQFRLFQGLRDMEEDRRILERMYAQCAIELLVFLDTALPLAARRSLHAKIGDIVTQYEVGSERSRLLLEISLEAVKDASEISLPAERVIRTFVRSQFALAADSAITRKEVSHA